MLEGIPAIVLLGPLLFPAARALGIHDVHYAMTVVLAMGLGLFAPPFGVGFYFSCAIGGATPDEAWTRVWPYLGALLMAVVLVAVSPGSPSASCRMNHQVAMASLLADGFPAELVSPGVPTINDRVRCLQRA